MDGKNAAGKSTETKPQFLKQGIELVCRTISFGLAAYTAYCFYMFSELNNVMLCAIMTNVPLLLLASVGMVFCDSQAFPVQQGIWAMLTIGLTQPGCNEQMRLMGGYVFMCTYIEYALKSIAERSPSEIETQQEEEKKKKSTIKADCKI